VQRRLNRGRGVFRAADELPRRPGLAVEHWARASCRSAASCAAAASRVSRMVGYQGLLRSLAVAADLQLPRQLCVRSLIGSLILFPLIARSHLAVFGRGLLPTSPARRLCGRTTVGNSVFLRGRPQPIPSDAAAWRAARAAHTGGTATRQSEQ
jgi:hypothetical protein